MNIPWHYSICIILTSFYTWFAFLPTPIAPIPFPSSSSHPAYPNGSLPWLGHHQTMWAVDTKSWSSRPGVGCSHLKFWKFFWKIWNRKLVLHPTVFHSWCRITVSLKTTQTLNPSNPFKIISDCFYYTYLILVDVVWSFVFSSTSLNPSFSSLRPHHATSPCGDGNISTWCHQPGGMCLRSGRQSPALFPGGTCIPGKYYIYIYIYVCIYIYTVYMYIFIYVTCICIYVCWSSITLLLLNWKIINITCQA